MAALGTVVSKHWAGASLLNSEMSFVLHAFWFVEAQAFLLGLQAWEADVWAEALVPRGVSAWRPDTARKDQAG